MLPIEVGVGAHYGKAIVGVVGDGERLEYTVIGDTVNLAQRAERVAARSATLLLVTRDLLESARAVAPQSVYETIWNEPDPLPLAGRRLTVRFFSSRRHVPDSGLFFIRCSRPHSPKLPPLLH